MQLPWPLRPFFFVQDFLGGLYVAIGMLFYWIMPYSHSHSLSVFWAFLGGIYVAIGMLFYWIMLYSHSHSLAVLWAFLGGIYVPIGMLFYCIMPYSHSHSLSVLWAFLGGLYAPIGMLFYWIMSYSHSHITLAWFASSPLHLPSHSLTHSTPTGLPVLCSHQVLRASTHDFGLLCFVPSPPTTCSLTLPQWFLLHFMACWLYGLCHRWFGCSSNVSHQ